MTNYKVTLEENFEGNNGNPDYETFEFKYLKDARKKYRELLKVESDTHGVYTSIELVKVDENENVIADIENDRISSALLPKDCVIVTFKHVRYMYYAYQIISVRFVEDGDRYEDLHVSKDYTSSHWDAIFKSVDELQDAYENGRYMPMDKINSGSSIIEEFLAENGVNQYIIDENNEIIEYKF